MVIQKLSQRLTVCRLSSLAEWNADDDFYFIGKTDEELSLVCETSRAPAHSLAREDGWRGFRIQGVLDFSLIGILSRISTALAQAGIGIFAVSTYNTDYILVKSDDFDRAAQVLAAAGYTVTG